MQPLRAALLAVREPERYRVLAALLTELAEHSPSEGGRAAPGEELEALARKVQVLEKEKASVEDTLRTIRADLDLKDRQLQAEQARATEIQQIINDQRSRLQNAEQELQNVEAEVVARNNELHRAEVKIEELELQWQRAEVAGRDHSRIDGLESGKRELAAQVEELKGQMEQLRADKDAQIEQLKDERARAESVSSESADKLLTDLWQRLAVAKPPLAEGHIAPNRQAGERLVDAFIELVRFVDDFDKSMRVFLGRYTKHHPSVKVPWDAYANGGELLEFVRRTVAPQGGRPVGPLKMRLRLLYSWTQAGMVGSDAAIESIGSELQGQLMGSVGAGSDPNRKIRDYVRDDGHLLFLQHIKELRSLKLAETFGRG